MQELGKSAETLVRVFAGEPVDRVLDDISSQPSQNGDEHCVRLERLFTIHVKRGDIHLSCSREQLFSYPPIYEASLIQGIFQTLELDPQPYRCSDVIIKAPYFMRFIQVESGFWTSWEVYFLDQCIGKMKTTGNFWDRSSEIILDFSDVQSKQ